MLILKLPFENVVSVLWRNARNILAHPPKQSLLLKKAGLEMDKSKSERLNVNFIIINKNNHYSCSLELIVIMNSNWWTSKSVNLVNWVKIDPQKPLQGKFLIPPQLSEAQPSFESHNPFVSGSTLFLKTLGFFRSRSSSMYWHLWASVTSRGQCWSMKPSLDHRLCLLPVHWADK